MNAVPILWLSLEEKIQDGCKFDINRLLTLTRTNQVSFTDIPYQTLPGSQNPGVDGYMNLVDIHADTPKNENF